MIITRTPVRVSFFGGGTDYPSWFREYGGAVISTTIGYHAYITCRSVPPFYPNRFTISYSKIELADSVDEIEHPSVRETLRYVGVQDQTTIHYNADLPARTGLGSSSTFTVGLLHALLGLQGERPTAMQLAQGAIQIEQELIKESVGSQDQTAAAFGGFNRIEFFPDGTLEVNPVRVSNQRLASLQDHLMLIFTGFSRDAAEIAAAQLEVMPRHAGELMQMRHMVDEAESLLAGDGDLGWFGKLLNESWQLKRRLSPAVSTPPIDEIYDAALQSGALGGKLLGAGGGGFMLLFVEPETKPRVRQRLHHLTEIPVLFESRGSEIIFQESDSSVQPAAKAIPRKRAAPTSHS